MYFICSGYLVSVGTIAAWLNDVASRHKIVRYDIFHNVQLEEGIMYEVIVQCSES